MSSPMEFSIGYTQAIAETRLAVRMYQLGVLQHAAGEEPTFQVDPEELLERLNDLDETLRDTELHVCLRENVTVTPASSTIIMSTREKLLALEPGQIGTAALEAVVDGLEQSLRDNGILPPTANAEWFWQAEHSTWYRWSEEEASYVYASGQRVSLKALGMN